MQNRVLRKPNPRILKDLVKNDQDVFHLIYKLSDEDRYVSRDNFVMEAKKRGLETVYSISHLLDNEFIERFEQRPSFFQRIFQPSTTDVFFRINPARLDELHDLVREQTEVLRASAGARTPGPRKRGASPESQGEADGV